jgi:hypothetical protein
MWCTAIPRPATLEFEARAEPGARDRIEVPCNVPEIFGTNLV